MADLRIEWSGAARDDLRAIVFHFAQDKVFADLRRDLKARLAPAAKGRRKRG